jgi:hypothetical protein
VVLTPNPALSRNCEAMGQARRPAFARITQPPRRGS